MPRPSLLLPLLQALLLALTAVGPTAVTHVLMNEAASGAAPATGVPPPRDLPSFGWPLPAPPPVVQPFEAPSSPYGPGHRGVDLAGEPGMPVVAAADGVVAFAGPVAGRSVVSIDHAGGLRTTYEPLEVLVSAGQQVTRGTVVGRLLPGHPGCPSACLHWGLRRGAEYLDPLGLLKPGRVRLLPWADP